MVGAASTATTVVVAIVVVAAETGGERCGSGTVGGWCCMCSQLRQRRLRWKPRRLLRSLARVSFDRAHIPSSYIYIYLCSRYCLFRAGCVRCALDIRRVLIYRQLLIVKSHGVREADMFVFASRLNIVRLDIVRLDLIRINIVRLNLVRLNL